MKKIVLTMLMCASILLANAQLITRDFLTGYTVGQTLEKGAYPSTTQGEANPILVNQWNLSGKTGSSDQGGANPLVVAPLSYTGYIESGKDVAIDLLKTPSGENRTSIYSIASDYTYGAGTYYLSFMMNVSTASVTSGNEFIALDGNYTANGQRARFGVKGIKDTDTYMVALGDGGTPPADGFKGEFNYGTTYLVVIKATLNEDSANPGQGDGTGTSWVYVNPDVNGTEPATAFSTIGISGTALKSVRGVVVRQRSTQALQVGGIRLTQSWKDALAQVTLTITQPSANGTITDIAGTYAQGSEISLTAIPAQGYALDKWIVNGEEQAEAPTTITADMTVSATFKLSTGINEISVNKEVVSQKYFTLTGIEIQQPTTGIVIQKTTYANGAVETTKILK